VMWGWMPEWGDYEPLATVELRATDIDRKWLIEVGHWTGTGPESGKSFDWPRAIRALGAIPLPAWRDRPRTSPSGSGHGRRAWISAASSRPCRHWTGSSPTASSDPLNRPLTLSGEP